MKFGESVSKVYKSKFDNSYIIHLGMENHIKRLADREIIEELTHGVGFSPKDKKWYGWSHRAIFGFKVGSTCKKGDCSYRPVDEADSIDDGVKFWSDDNHLNVRARIPIEHEEGRGVVIEWEYTDDVPNKKLRNMTGSIFWRFPDAYGKGEWTALTMEDAKQMAKDFNEGVS